MEYDKQKGWFKDVCLVVSTMLWNLRPGQETNLYLFINFQFYLCWLGQSRPTRQHVIDCVRRSVAVEAATWRCDSTWRQGRARYALRDARTTVENIEPVERRLHQDGEKVSKVWRHRTDRGANRSANSYTHREYSLQYTAANVKVFFSFYRATHMHSEYYVVARCLSVRLSHAGILSKRLHISWMFFHRRLAPPF